jgi:hypothetical protein
MAREMNITFQELKARIEAYYRGEKVKLEKSIREFVEEVKRTYIANQRLKLSYT